MIIVRRQNLPAHRRIGPAILRKLAAALFLGLLDTSIASAHRAVSHDKPRKDDQLLFTLEESA